VLLPFVNGHSTNARVTQLCNVNARLAYWFGKATARLYQRLFMSMLGYTYQLSKYQCTFHSNASLYQLTISSSKWREVNNNKVFCQGDSVLPCEPVLTIDIILSRLGTAI
jgi:hypothetical protein